MTSPHVMAMAAGAHVRYKLAFIRVLGAGGQYVVVQVKLMMFKVRGCGAERRPWGITCLSNMQPWLPRLWQSAE